MKDDDLVLAPRFLSRVAAMQAVYALYTSCLDYDETVVFFTNTLSNRPLVTDLKTVKFHKELFLDLVYQFHCNRETIFNLVSQHIKSNWTMDRIDRLSISVLSCGITEFMYLKTDKKIIINEYIELSKLYGINYKFINGVLHCCSLLK